MLKTFCLNPNKFLLRSGTYKQVFSELSLISLFYSLTIYFIDLLTNNLSLILG